MAQESKLDECHARKNMNQSDTKIGKKNENLMKELNESSVQRNTWTKNDACELYQMTSEMKRSKGVCDKCRKMNVDEMNDNKKERKD